MERNYKIEEIENLSLCTGCSKSNSAPRNTPMTRSDDLKDIDLLETPASLWVINCQTHLVNYQVILCIIMSQ